MINSGESWQLITTFNEAGEGTLIEPSSANWPSQKKVSWNWECASPVTTQLVTWSWCSNWSRVKNSSVHFSAFTSRLSQDAPQSMRSVPLLSRSQTLTLSALMEVIRWRSSCVLSHKALMFTRMSSCWAWVRLWQTKATAHLTAACWSWGRWEGTLIRLDKFLVRSRSPRHKLSEKIPLNNIWR